MILEINDTTAIRHIQEVFSGRYPYLEINFFFHAPGSDQLYQKKDLVPTDCIIGSIKKTHVSAIIEIQPWNTIADIEKEFLQRFGLRVQILRNCYSHWLIPEGADNLTLNEQNEIGEKASAHIIHPDYDTRIEDSEY